MASGWISKGARKRIYERDALICCYCERQCRQANTREDAKPYDIATLDHIVSQKELAASSTDDSHFSVLRKDPHNLVVVCMLCNSSKKHTPLYVWCRQTGRNYQEIIARIAERTSKSI